MPVQVCHRLSHRLSLSALALAATGALLACGDGSGTQPDNGAGTPPAANLAPTGVAQPTVKPGPLGSGTASATWAAASDDATAESALVYQLHASTQPDFTPGSSTLVFEGTGAHQGSVANFDSIYGRFRRVVRAAGGDTLARALLHEFISQDPKGNDDVEETVDDVSDAAGAESSAQSGDSDEVG